MLQGGGARLCPRGPVAARRERKVKVITANARHGYVLRVVLRTHPRSDHSGLTQYESVKAERNSKHVESHYEREYAAPDGARDIKRGGLRLQRCRSSRSWDSRTTQFDFGLRISQFEFLSAFEFRIFLRFAPASRSALHASSFTFHVSRITFPFRAASQPRQAPRLGVSGAWCQEAPPLRLALPMNEIESPASAIQ